MKLMKAVAGIVALMLAASTTVGCSSQDAAKNTDLSIVIVPTLGGALPATEEVDKALELIQREGDRFTIVVADGAPEVVLDRTVTALPEFEPEADAEMKTLRRDVTTLVTQQVANDPQIDLSAAIALGNQTFREGNRKVLVVLGSGLQTVGALSMTEGKFYHDAADLVRFATDSGEVPSMNGVEVRMPQFGVVTEPQPAITEDARGQLAEIWRAYFDAAQVESLDLTPGSLTARPLEGALPEVTPIVFERPEFSVTASCVQRLEQSTVNFAAGSWDLNDVAKATADLEKALAGLNGCEGTYRINASASSEGEAEANQLLSERRAETIRDVLVSITNLAVEDFETTGWGEVWPCRQNDVDANGHLILEAANANRVVVVSKGIDPC